MIKKILSKDIENIIERYRILSKDIEYYYKIIYFIIL